MATRLVSWVIDNSTTRGVDRLVLLAIADAADHRGCAFRDVYALSVFSNATAAEVEACLSRLVSRGEITDDEEELWIRHMPSIEMTSVYERKLPENWQQLRRAVMERDGPECMYCGGVVFEDATIDHVLPLCRGGTHELRNLVVCCKSCNSRKGQKTLEEWLQVSIDDVMNRVYPAAPRIQKPEGPIQ